MTFAYSAIFNQSKSQFKATFASISHSKACKVAMSLMLLCHQSHCFPLPVHWLNNFLLLGAAQRWSSGGWVRGGGAGARVVSRLADDENSGSCTSQCVRLRLDVPDRQRKGRVMLMCGDVWHAQSHRWSFRQGVTDTASGRGRGDWLGCWGCFSCFGTDLKTAVWLFITD